MQMILFLLSGRYTATFATSRFCDIVCAKSPAVPQITEYVTSSERESYQSCETLSLTPSPFQFGKSPSIRMFES